MLESFPPGVNAAIFVASAAVVWFAGSHIARYADALAEKTGIGHEALGLVLLGGVTSSPELAVAVTATISGVPELSVSDVLGSASINVLILALADAVFGRGALTSTLVSTGVMLQGLLSVVVLGVVVAVVNAGDVAVLGMGIGSWLLLAAYGLALRIILSSRGETWIPAHTHRQPAAETTGPAYNDPLPALVWRTAAAGAAILVAGFALAQSAEALAQQTGLGTHFFGVVVLAAATSLPEVSTVVAAVRLRRYEMAISDVFGTNLFNVMIIVVVDALHRGAPILVEVGRFAAFGALLAMLMSLLFLIGMVERRNHTVLRMGIDSIAALACYTAGLVVLYHLR